MTDSSRQRVVVTNWVHPDVLDFLAAHHEVDANLSRDAWPRDEVLCRVADAEAMMAFMPDSVDDSFLEACPRLRIIAGALKGYDNFDRAACTRRGVWLTVVPDLLTEHTAELTVGLMISLARNILAGDRHVRSGAFGGWRPRFFGTGLTGASVGIVGMGAVGRAVAERLRPFGCHILYADKRPLPPDQEERLGARQATRDELLADSDFVVLALHLTAETLHYIDRDGLGAMKRGSYLINPARGSLVDESAVADALEDGSLAGYAADVFEMEDWARAAHPGGIDERLLHLADRTLFTPHLGSAVDAARHDIAMAAAHSIVECLDGRPPSGAVNIPVQRG